MARSIFFLIKRIFKIIIDMDPELDPDPRGSALILPPVSGSTFRMRIRIKEAKNKLESAQGGIAGSGSA